MILLKETQMLPHDKFRAWLQICVNKHPMDSEVDVGKPFNVWRLLNDSELLNPEIDFDEDEDNVALAMLETIESAYSKLK